MTHFDADVSPRHQLKAQHPGLDALYPTSRWPVRQIVRDDFQVDVPPSYPSMLYAMHVEVKRGDVTVAPELDEQQGTLTLADVDVRTSSSVPLRGLSLESTR